MASNSTTSFVVEERDIPMLLAKLRPHLPYCIPLYRRIQFHLVHPNPPHAHAFLAQVEGNLSDGVAPDPTVNLGPSESTSSSATWLAAHLDLSNSGQSQVWVYASWESAAASSPNSLEFDPDSDIDPASTTPLPPLSTRRALFSELFTHIHNNLIPLRPTSPPTHWLELERDGKYLSKPYSRSKVLFATLNASLWRCLPHQTPGFVSRVDRWYSKFLFAPPSATRSSSSPVTSLPQALDFGPLVNKHLQTVADRRYNQNEAWHASTPAPEPSSATPSTGATTPAEQALKFAPLARSHLQTVLDRSPIPRTLSVLSQLESVGLFVHDDPTPIGWGFLGKDASLSSLHTEPEYRGKGLAVRISEKLFEIQRDSGGIFSDQTGDETKRGWCHADVSEKNAGSLRVMAKLGGQLMWRVCWVEVDMASIF